MRVAAALLAVPLLLLPAAPVGAEPAGDGPVRCGGPGSVTIDADSPTLVTGTEGPDTFWVVLGEHEVRTLGGDDTVCAGRGARLTAVDLGDGDDDLLLADAGEARGRTVLAGGAGTDRVAALYERTVDLDLGAGRLEGRYGRHAATYRVYGFEDAAVTAVRARVVGDAGPNLVSVHACRATVAGGAGADTLLARPSAVADVKPGPGCRGLFRLTARGGPGADTIHGRRSSETLIGGPGRDTIDGGGGDDTCDAEKTRNCS